MEIHDAVMEIHDGVMTPGEIPKIFEFHFRKNFDKRKTILKQDRKYFFRHDFDLWALGVTETLFIL